MVFLNKLFKNYHNLIGRVFPQAYRHPQPFIQNSKALLQGEEREGEDVEREKRKEGGNRESMGREARGRKMRGTEQACGSRKDTGHLRKGKYICQHFPVTRRFQ